MTELSSEVKAVLLANPEGYLTDEDNTEFAEWVERNRLRKARISMETGIAHVG